MVEMQSDDTIDSFFAVNSDLEFDKDESMDINVSVCSLIPQFSRSSGFSDTTKEDKLSSTFKLAVSPTKNDEFSIRSLPTIGDKIDNHSSNSVFVAPMSAPKIVYTCNKCAKTFTSRLEFDKHYRTTYNQEPLYTCNICNRSIQNMRTFRGHYTRHSTTNIKCKLCPKKFFTEAELIEHGKAHTSNRKMLQCKMCDQSFEHLNDFNRHRSEHTPDAVAKQRWKCPDCGKFFITRNTLFIHSKIHKEERNYECSLCPQKFVQKVNLINHVKGHTGDRPFACDACEKSFVGKYQLLRHQIHHLDVRPFKCDTCGKTYKSEHDLKMHNMVHSERRPYLCTHCGKSFLSTSKLRQHYNIHTGARPYKCKYCDKDFTNFPNWMKHVRRRHKVDHKTGEPLEVTALKSKKSVASPQPKQSIETANVNETPIKEDIEKTTSVQPTSSIGSITIPEISSDGPMNSDDYSLNCNTSDFENAAAMCMQQLWDDEHLMRELELYSCDPQSADCVGYANENEKTFFTIPAEYNPPQPPRCAASIVPIESNTSAAISLPPITLMTNRLNTFGHS